LSGHFPTVDISGHQWTLVDISGHSDVQLFEF